MNKESVVVVKFTFENSNENIATLRERVERFIHQVMDESDQDLLSAEEMEQGAEMLYETLTEEEYNTQPLLEFDDQKGEFASSLTDENGCRNQAVIKKTLQGVAISLDHIDPEYEARRKENPDIELRNHGWLGIERRKHGWRLDFAANNFDEICQTIFINDDGEAELDMHCKYSS